MCYTSISSGFLPKPLLIRDDEHLLQLLHQAPSLPSSFKVEKRGKKLHAVSMPAPKHLISLASLSPQILVLEHLPCTRMMTMHGQASRTHSIGQESRVQNLASARQGTR
jgi:hypothetical protein